MSKESEKVTFVSLREVASCVNELPLDLTIFNFFHD